MTKLITKNINDSLLLTLYIDTLFMQLVFLYLFLVRRTLSHCASVLNQLCARTRANERRTINVSGILRAASRRSRYRRLKLREGHTRLVAAFLFLVSYRRVYRGSDTDPESCDGDDETRGNAREPVFRPIS